LPQVQADVLVANILAGPLVSLAPQLSGLVKPGGRLALSGILAEQGEEVAAAYARTSTWTRSPIAMAGCASPAVGARMSLCIIRIAA
jgi:ribosomal protein L11 methylase PrmA